MSTSSPFIIGCLGDSLTDGYPGFSTYYSNGQDQRSCYQYWLRKSIEAEYGPLFEKKDMELRFVDKGICGEITEQIAQRLYPEVIDETRHEYKKNPDFIIIIGGTNDLGWGIDAAVIEKNIAQMHSLCKKEGIKSVGATIPPTRFEDDPAYNTAKKDINERLIRFYTSENIPFADLYRSMGTSASDENLHPSFDAGDGLHFSVEGYKMMGTAIYEQCFRGLLESIF